MDNSYNDNMKPYLDLTEDLSKYLKGTDIKIPIIVICGMQSHGKSSTLESITHISLPQGDGTKTICPIKISLRNANEEEEYARVKYESQNDDSYEKISIDEIQEKVDAYQEKVKKNANKKALYDRVIQVEVNKKNVPNLTLYDLPGINFDKDIQQKSMDINKRFLNKEEATVLLVVSGTEEVTNSAAIDLMRGIKNYKNRFSIVISKADLFKNKDIKLYMKEIKKLELSTSTSIIVNKCGEYKDLSYEEMEKKEEEIINSIPKISEYPLLNKGTKKLIKYLTKIQQNNLMNTFKNISSKIKKEIKERKAILSELPKECKSKEEAVSIFKKLILKFKKNILEEMERVNCDKFGRPNDNLMKYDIQLAYSKHVRNVKIKINTLFSKSFCDEITNNIIQNNSDNINIIEDTIAFNHLIKPKVEDILSGFNKTIDYIYDNMVTKIQPIIKASFGGYENLLDKVSNIFYEYSENKKEKMLKFYKQIFKLETENISTFDKMNLSNHINTLNKHINYIFYKQLKIEVNNEINNIEEQILELSKDKKEDEKNLQGIKDDELKEPEGDGIKEDQNQDIKKDEEKKEEVKDETGKSNIFEIKEPIKNEKVMTTIDDLTTEVTNNPLFGEDVKKRFNEKSALLQSLIKINYNYENERNTRFYDSIDYKGRIKIGYRPQDMGAFSEKIENQESLKYNKLEKGEIEFIPGFQFIEKNELNKFIKNIMDGKIEMRTVNTIAQMISYLEIMCTRVLDTIFLAVQKYLYDSLTNEKMIDNIRSKLYLLDFEECKNLIEINPEKAEIRKECNIVVKNLNEALKRIEKLKKNDVKHFFDSSEDKKDEKLENSNRKEDDIDEDDNN